MNIHHFGDIETRNCCCCSRHIQNGNAMAMEIESTTKSIVKLIVYVQYSIGASELNRQSTRCVHLWKTVQWTMYVQTIERRFNEINYSDEIFTETILYDWRRQRTFNEPSYSRTNK